MESAHVVEEQPRQDTDLACRERDPIFTLEHGADFLTLPVMQETLKPDPHHDVVAHAASGDEQLGQRRGPPPYQAAVRATAVGGTAVHDFPELEGAVFQGLNRAEMVWARASALHRSGRALLRKRRCVRRR